MASMISYFGYVCRDEGECKKDPSSTFCWDGEQDLGSNLNRMKCPVGQMKFLLEQSLAAAYYLKIYGLRCHDVINDYIEELNADITFRFNNQCGHQFTDNFLKVYNTLQNLVKFNRGGNWVDVDIRLIQEFLFDGVKRTCVPVVWAKPDCLVPFLMWMNKGVQPEYTTFAAEHCGVTSFSISRLPLQDEVHDYLTVDVTNHAIGRSFSVERTSLDRLTSCPILGILSHFDWTTTSFESCVGIISEFCIHSDINRYGVSLSHHLAYCMRQGVMSVPSFDVTGKHAGIEPVVSKYHEQLFNAMLAFVTFCTEKRGMTLVDRNIVAKAFGCIAYTKEQVESVSYLRKANAVPSADELKSFNKVMGCVESLQLISQNPTLTTAQASQKVEGSTEDADPGKGEAKQPQSDNGAGESNKAEDDKSEPTQKEEGANDDAPTSNDDGADDTRSDDTLEEEPAGEPSSDDGGASTGESGDSSTQQEPSTQTGGAPEHVTTSDEEGIAFNFAVPDSSTVDSVLFREEMYKFLTNVLTNPPKCLSPQDIDTLTALKRFWLSCLSIETIKGIVEACIRLPKSIKHSIHKSTELQK